MNGRLCNEWEEKWGWMRKNNKYEKRAKICDGNFQTNQSK
jgi:hypothetical protein